jgi:hypothetical protein
MRLIELGSFDTRGGINLVGVLLGGSYQEWTVGRTGTPGARRVMEASTTEKV